DLLVGEAEVGEREGRHRRLLISLWRGGWRRFGLRFGWNGGRPALVRKPQRSDLLVGEAEVGEREGRHHWLLISLWRGGWRRFGLRFGWNGGRPALIR